MSGLYGGLIFYALSGKWRLLVGCPLAVITPPSTSLPTLHKMRFGLNADTWPAEDEEGGGGGAELAVLPEGLHLSALAHTPLLLLCVSLNVAFWRMPLHKVVEWAGGSAIKWASSHIQKQYIKCRLCTFKRYILPRIITIFLRFEG